MGLTLKFNRVTNISTVAVEVSFETLQAQSELLYNVNLTGLNMRVLNPLSGYMTFAQDFPQVKLWLGLNTKIILSIIAV